MFKRILLITWLLSGYCLSVRAYNTAAQDSLFKVLQQQRADTGRVNTLFAYAMSYMPDSMHKAEGIFREALRLSRQLNYPKGVADFACYYMYIQDMLGRYEESLLMVDKAVEIYAALRDTTNLMRALSYSGNEHQQMGNYPAAANRYLEALKLADASRDRFFSGLMNNNLAALFIRLQDAEKAFRYAEKAYHNGVDIGNNRRIASSLITMGSCMVELKRYAEGEHYYRKAIDAGQGLEDSAYILKANVNLGNLYFEQGKRAEAYAQYSRSLALSQKYPQAELLTYIYLGYGRELFNLKRYSEALSYVEKAITMARQYKATNELRWGYLVASNLHATLGRYQQAFALREKFEALNDSLTGNAARNNVMLLEMQYQTEKKDKELTSKELQLALKDLEIQHKNRWIFLFMLCTVLFLALVFLIWQRLKHRHRLQAQQLHTLEAEKTVQVLEAMIQGEEKERTRLSKDLHDGVGGLLSAVKMHFAALKHEQPVLRTDKSFGHAMHMLDDAIVEVRKTAHNLMPELLARMGLAEAVRFYCRNVSHSRQLTISCYVSENMGRLKANFELSVYRIVQELVNNIIKHSQATEALVQLTSEKQLLTITVEDNGIGFQEPAGAQPGMGLNALESRIRALNGNLEIAAAHGKGTTAYIEFDIGTMQLAVM
ncbi:tetratricopeptide repeat-containing sensor histidine kinase [Chitinophaga qingshengii]|uniref:Sensor histidine kinase n=1 Tax=Chitinophaga qingshengii TaxID=1569794 RepID=A0ABR7TNI8_9BACT|nr:tetratricopeptide repeat protein [Chitinophaga qingshengii]MBC9930989.1 sensor histidine kinase [Chitinophaga qingshengii]